METTRLYYQDAYLRDFSAHVIAHQTVDGRTLVALDRTAFYPTGGGQPNDTGTLAGRPVLDVTAEGGLVWHALAGEVPDELLSGEAEVTGDLDWERRFDHMQQHSGQHVLSEALIKTCQAQTVAFHLGTAYCTIDVDRADLDAEALAIAETEANQVIDQARPVIARFVSTEELARLPLRKPPKVAGPIRIVEVEGYDWSPCGGTHVANTAQIGLIKIVATERRNTEQRITFLCGGRARADYRRALALVNGLALRFSTGPDQLPDAVEKLQTDARSARKELETLAAEWAGARAAELAAAAETVGPWRVVALAADYPVERGRELAQALRGLPGMVVLLGVRGARPQLFFARSEGVGLDMGALMRSAAAAGGGRGGGRPDWAQGGTPDDAGLEAALAVARNTVSASAGAA